jgi:replication factor A1
MIKGEKMDISELNAGQGKIEVEGKITDKGDIREFEKFGKAGRVCNATLKDSTGEIKLSLWNEQIDNVNVGDRVKISNGYVSEFKGEKQLSTGKFGQLEVLDMTSEDHGEHILTGDEVEESKALNKELGEPDVEEEVTEDEMEEADMVNKASVEIDDDFQEDISFDEEKVE